MGSGWVIGGALRQTARAEAVLKPHGNPISL